MPTCPKLMQFIVPNPPALKVKLSVYEITQQYEYRESPPTVTMHETNGSGSTFLYVFRVTDREMIVESCTKTTVSGKRIGNPAGYLYLRLPMSRNQPEEWTYTLPGNIRVECIARLDVQEMNGKPCETIHLSRMFHYREPQNNQPDMIVERYVAGHGIYHRLELSNLKINESRNT